MALLKGIEKVVEAEGFDLVYLKAKIKELNDAGILEGKVKSVAVTKPVMVDGFLKAIESIPEGSAEEKAIPKDVTVLYNAYVDILEDKVLAIPVVVKEGPEVDGSMEKEPKAPKEPKIKRITRFQAVANILKQGISLTIEELAEKTDNEISINGGISNKRESSGIVKYSLKLLSALDFLDIDISESKNKEENRISIKKNLLEK